MKLGRNKLDNLATESLTVHAINQGRFAEVLPDVTSATLARGTGPEPDLWLHVRGVTRLGTGEAKGTGVSEWSRCNARDAGADVFVWVNCAPLCRGAGVVHFWVLPAPHRYLSHGQDLRSEPHVRALTKNAAVRVVVPLDALLGAST